MHENMLQRREYCVGPLVDHLKEGTCRYQDLACLLEWTQRQVTLVKFEPGQSSDEKQLSVRMFGSKLLL